MDKGLRNAGGIAAPPYTNGPYTWDQTLNFVIANPTVATNGIYSLMTAASAWTGSLTPLRVAATSNTTGAIGNMRTIQSILTMSAQPTSQGHTAAGYFEAATVNAATNVTGVISLVKSGAAGGAITPFINVIDASTTKTTIVMEFGTGGALGSGTGDSGVTAFSTGCTVATLAAATSCALRVKINGIVYFIPIATVV